MLHSKILKWTIIASDIVLAAALFTLASKQYELSRELLNMPLIIMIIGIVAAAFAFDYL